MNFKAGIYILCTGIIFLSGCGGGGGGGGGGGVSIAPLVSGSAALLATSDNSYRNFKQIGLTPHTLPAYGDARAYGDFSGHGRSDIFIAQLRYTLAQTPQTATPSRFSFWIQQIDGTYVEDTVLLSSNSGCIHPRKAIVADFNKDGKPDVFVACHGWDAAPFPGEKNKVILSQSDGTYLIKDASPDVGFFHAGTAADLNGDGYPDVALISSFDVNRAIVLLNKGDGTFVRESGTRLPTSIRGGNYFSIELLDINEDGVLDLALGGHEFEGAPTKVFINPGNNIFEGVSPITIPAVSNEGVVLDFAATGTGANRVLWVLRTSGGDGTFYQSRVIQKVTMGSLASTLALYQRPGGWVPWIIPTTVNGQNLITTDSAIDAVSVPQ